MKGKTKRIIEGNVQILSQDHEKQREVEGGHKMFLHPWCSRMFWPHDGSAVLGKLAPIPQQKGAVGEHRGDQMFSAMDGPVPCLVYLQDREKHKGLEKQCPGIGFELGVKLELLLRKGLWQWKEGWGQLWGTQMAPALPWTPKQLSYLSPGHAAALGSCTKEQCKGKSWNPWKPETPEQ